ncbi:MAG: redoxin domain-containing protein [Acidobacteriota bacterium]|nr:redoxin domain-containing protein [Acidobacteriota bacterium]MDW3228459.1 redoxin domain-containing protein [Acidobacteriota bacterium]MDY0231950.1 redoxin domain-containing protein [Candidatus Saccharicenans sp.]
MKNLKVLLPGFILFSLSLLWGYHNRIQFNQCYQFNQELLQELKSVSRTEKPEEHFLDEGDSFDHPLTLSLIDDRTVSLGAQDSCLLIFFETACPACLQAALELYLDFLPYEEQGLSIISVSRDLRENLLSLTSELNWPMAIAHDSTGQLHRLFRISSTPSIVFIGQGVIKLKANAMSIDRRLSEFHQVIAEVRHLPPGTS